MLNRFVWFIAEVSLRSSLKSGDETSARRVHKGHESRFFGAICRSNADTLAFIELVFYHPEQRMKIKIRLIEFSSVCQAYVLFTNMLFRKIFAIPRIHKIGNIHARGSIVPRELIVFMVWSAKQTRVCEDDNENKQLTLCMRRANPFVTKRCRISIVHQLDRTLGRRRAHSKFGGSKCFNLISNFITKELSTPDFVSHVFSLKMTAVFFFSKT